MAKEGETYKCETCGLTVRVTKSDKKGANIPYCRGGKQAMAKTG